MSNKILKISNIVISFELKTFPKRSGHSVLHVQTCKRNTFTEHLGLEKVLSTSVTSLLIRNSTGKLMRKFEYNFYI